MRAWFSRSDFTSTMISSFSFLYLRSCEGDSDSLCSWLAMSCSCRRRSFLYSEAILSNVSTTFGFSSASMAASDIWFSNSSSSMSPSAADSAGSFSTVSPPGAAAAAARNGVGDGGAADQRRVHVVLGVGAGIGGFEIDDVAEEDLSFVQFIAPDDDGLEGERALAQPRDHRLAAGLDALGDGDFALAREQFDRAHLAQIHAHGIVGALRRLFLLGGGQRFG